MFNSKKHNISLMGQIIVWPLLFLMLNVSWANESQYEKVANSRYWKLLLHYRDGYIFDRSEADGKEFFFAKDGYKNPLSELKATIAAFSNKSLKVGNLKQHPQCAFPERYRYLKEQLNLKIKSVSCPEFRKWITGINPEGLQIVFSSPYLGDPSSMFGHTFLKVKTKGKKSELRDYAISFEAAAPKDDSFLKVPKGLFGFYPGLFNIKPYVLKVKEYNFIESRSLWEYTLNLNTKQVKRMLAHLWETGTTHFDYYFFDENCSYHLLSLLEIANPEWDLRSKFGVATIPGDVVKLLDYIDGAITEIKYRPSLTQRLKYKISNLNKEEYSLLKEYIKKKKVTKYTPRLVDTFIEYNQYLNTKDSSEERKKEIHALNIQRSKMAKAHYSKEMILEKNRPDLGHSSTKISLYQGFRRAEGFYGLRYKVALHDTDDFHIGYQKNSTLNIADFQGRYWKERERFEFQRFTFAEVISLSPANIFQSNKSWSIAGGLRSLSDVCLNCTGVYFDGGLGLSTYFNRSESVLGNVMIKLVTDINAHLDDSFRIGPNLELNLDIDYSDTWKQKFGFVQSYYFNQDSNYKYDSKISTMLAYNIYDDFMLSGNYYYRFNIEGDYPDIGEFVLNFNFYL